jgi:hypothetical protein
MSLLDKRSQFINVSCRKWHIHMTIASGHHITCSDAHVPILQLNLEIVIANQHSSGRSA